MKCIQCDMADVLDASYTDPDFEDLIEWAFLEGQIDGEAMELTYQWITTTSRMRSTWREFSELVCGLVCG